MPLQQSSVRRPSFAPGRHAPGLRVATHNVRGFGKGAWEAIDGQLRAPPLAIADITDKLHALVALWAQLKLDVVCLQETHLRDERAAAATQLRLDEAAASLLCPGFTAFWGNNTSTSGGAGVAVLVRTSLLDRGAITVREQLIARDPKGRLLVVPLSWAGHEMRLVVCYFPNRPGDQMAYCSQVLRPHLERAAAGGQVVLLGDLNHTFDPVRERFRVLDGGEVQASAVQVADGSAPTTSRNHQAELRTAETFLGLCTAHTLVDALRHKHPRALLFTWFSRSAASLIDRVMVSQALLGYVHQCHVQPWTVSDHRPVVLHLLPAAPVAVARTRRPTPRFRTDFAADPDLLHVFRGWAAEECHAAPARPSQLINWWPAFKHRLAAKLVELQAAFRDQRQRGGPAAQQAHQRARADLRVAQLRFEDAQPGDMPDALQGVLSAQRAYSATLAAQALPADSRARFAWLHQGERAGPLLTRLTRPPQATGQIAVLRDARSGGVITEPRAIADTVVRHFAQVSGPAHCAPAARAQVLDAVRAHAIPLATADAAAVAATVVTATEVQRAAGGQRPGTAPGPDGLPGAVWKLADRALQPLLTRLYSAIGECGRVPAGFLDGQVAALHKGGDATDVSNYRPITLLNTDYRVLTRVLASRLGRALAKVIGPEQSAFLPGRGIGNNIHVLQLLPAVLASQRGTPELPEYGAVAFLDFAKAYDTVDRQFLYDMLHAVGGGEFVPWVQLLLSGTHAVAVVNGVVSHSAEWHAGVRQGCPLSPVLYLLVPWGLSCWLRTQEGIGLRVGGYLCFCVQYADDVQVFLRSWREGDVRPLVTCMSVFKDATGQGLNLPKCRLLPVGNVPAAQAPRPVPDGGTPALVCGIPLVRQAKALGVLFSSTVVADGTRATGLPGAHTGGDTTPAGGDWNAMTVGYRRACAKLARLHMSPFGYACAASAYGISTVLYHAEFCGMPQDIAQDLTRMVARLVDRGVGPDMHPGDEADQANARRHNGLPGLYTDVLPGRPADGAYAVGAYASGLRPPA